MQRRVTHSAQTRSSRAIIYEPPSDAGNNLSTPHEANPHFYHHSPPLVPTAQQPCVALCSRAHSMPLCTANALHSPTFTLDQPSASLPRHPGASSPPPHTIPPPSWTTSVRHSFPDTCPARVWYSLTQCLALEPHSRFWRSPLAHFVTACALGLESHRRCLSPILTRSPHVPSIPQRTLRMIVLQNESKQHQSE